MRKRPGRGIAGGKDKARIALETRQVKDERPLSEMKPEWRKTAESHGFTARDVKKILEQRRPELAPRRAEAIIADAINKAIAKHASEQAHFSKQDLVTEVCVATVTRGIDPRAIRARVEDTLRDGRFVSLGRHREQDRYATKEMYQAIESRAIEAAERLGARHTRVVSERRVEKAIAKEPRLNEGQREAIRTVCRGPDLTLLVGPPGSGKSTLFEVARKAIENQGGNVIGLAPSNLRRGELEKSSGITSYTVHRFLYDRERTVLDAAKHHAKMVMRTALGLPTWKPPKLEINRRTTIIIDECAMVDNEKLGRALAHAEKAGCRVVLVGDHRQLPAVGGPGGLFRELTERARPEQKAALTEIVRQRETWAREAIVQVGQGEAAAALKTYEEKGRLHVAPTRADAERRLIELWKGAAPTTHETT